MSDERTIKPNAPADFTPQLGDYKTLSPFRYWCQKVLPLVYDDSLSYYELLCKVVDYLNKTMEDVETLHDDVTSLHTAYEELQSYVNNYFSTLDVQEEINNKLDEMVQNGTIMSLFTSTLVPYAMPEWYGAKGDGITNDTNAIITACAHSNILYLTKQYKIESLNITKNNLTITGGGCLLGNLTIEKSDNITINNISLNGGGVYDIKTQTFSGSEIEYGILLRGCTNYKILNCNIYGFLTDNIKIASTIDGSNIKSINGKIENNNIYYCGEEGIDAYSSGKNLIISNNYIHDCFRCAILKDYGTNTIDDKYSTDIIYTSNYCYNLTRGLVINTNNVICENNIFTNIYDTTLDGYAIGCGPIDTHESIYTFNCTIKNNVLYNIKNGINISQLCKDLKICDNTIYNSKIGIYVNCDNIDLNNNILYNLSTGIQVTNTSNTVNIINNNIHDIETSAILSRSCGIINNNKINNANYGINITLTNTDNLTTLILSNNIISNIKTYCFNFNMIEEIFKILHIYNCSASENIYDYNNALIYNQKGNSWCKEIGESSGRPTKSTYAYPLQTYYDTTLNKPIYRNNLNNKWINFDGSDA